ncbi:Endoribonuclease L-PSP [Venturia nashicola]|nr:Endoribonuclease L-PSP [Venturia nashicola]
MGAIGYFASAYHFQREARLGPDWNYLKAQRADELCPNLDRIHPTCHSSNGTHILDAGSYTQAVRVGNTIICSGQGADLSQGLQVHDDVEKEINQALANCELNPKNAVGKEGKWDSIPGLIQLHTEDRCEAQPSHNNIASCVTPAWRSIHFMARYYQLAEMADNPGTGLVEGKYFYYCEMQDELQM